MERYQDSQQNVTSKELKVNGGLNLAVRRAKPNNAGPGISTESGESAEKKDKKITSQDSGKQKAAAAAELTKDVSQSESDRDNNTSTPKKRLKENSQEITRKTSAAKILETFQSRDLATEDWNELSEQVLTRGFQKEAEAILKNADGSEDERTNAPPGFSDESGEPETTIRRSGRQNKRKGPLRFGNPVTHSIKLITSDHDVFELNKAAIEAYRVRLATLKPDDNNPAETKMGLLE